MTPAPRILIVDDETPILFLLGRILAAEGYHVATASNGDEALRLARLHHFDLFLVDLIMPSKDGIETILALRARQYRTPIIAMSGGWSGGARNCLPLAEKLGANDTLPKPFGRDELLAMVRKHTAKTKLVAV